MNKLTLKELFSIKRKVKNNKSLLEKINFLINESLINEDGECFAGASTMGGGNVVGSSPSTNIGSTVGSAYTSGGGTVGSGDVSVPYNTGSNKMAFLKQNGYGFNPKRKNTKKRNNLSVKKPSGKIMSFSDFEKNKTTKVKDFKNKNK